jgi:hypothetical protein
MNGMHLNSVAAIPRSRFQSKVTSLEPERKK